MDKENNPLLDALNKAEKITEVRYKLKPHFTDLNKINKLYHSINNLMAKMGAIGEVNTKMECSDAVMAALYEIDGGEYHPKRDLFTTNTISIEKPDQK